MARLGLLISKQSFSGPIPPPEILTGYGQVLPDAPDRILRMAENQSAHRQKLEYSMVIGSLVRSNLGMLFGFIIGFAGLYWSYLLIAGGHEISGGAFGGATLVSLVYTFLSSHDKQTKELAEKKKQSEELIAHPDQSET